MHYLFWVRSHLDPAWSDWLEGLVITHEPDGTSRLRGVVRDQAALYGLIIRLRDLGLELIAVTPEPPAVDAPPDPEG